MSIESQNGVSHRRSRAAVGLAACAVAALSSGVVFAGSASATPTALADKFASTVTDDGWSLDLAATKLSANPVPNLATTAFTREGFVSAKVTGTIGGAGDSAVKTSCRAGVADWLPDRCFLRTWLGAWFFRSVRLSV